MQCTYELLHANTRGRRAKYKRMKVHITLCVYCLVLHIESILDICYMIHYVDNSIFLLLTYDTFYILFVGRLMIM